MTDVQKVILSIYKEVAKICNENKIPYYAIGGTCIGAIRHKGFIPWDDDLDIAVPIEYWDKLFKTLEEELPSNLYLYHSDNVKPYHFIWLKVCDKDTTFIEKSEYGIEEAFKGVFIDIMPISGIPSRHQNNFIKKLQRLRRDNIYMRFSGNYSTKKGYIYDKMFKIVRKLLPFNYFSKKYISELKNYPLLDSDYTGYVWHAEWLPRLIFPSMFFLSSIEWPFEDTTIPVPREYDKYLSQQFGDYMQLPPENKRETHMGLIDLHNSFISYYGKDLKSI